MTKINIKIATVLLGLTDIFQNRLIQRSSITILKSLSDIDLYWLVQLLPLYKYYHRTLLILICFILFS